MFLIYNQYCWTIYNLFRKIGFKNPFYPTLIISSLILGCIIAELLIFFNSTFINPSYSMTLGFYIVLVYLFSVINFILFMSERNFINHPEHDSSTGFLLLIISILALYRFQYTNEGKVIPNYQIQENNEKMDRFT